MAEAQSDILVALQNEIEALKSRVSELERLQGVGTPSVVDSRVFARENVVHSSASFTPEEKIALFRSLFVGRPDVYAKRWESKKTGKVGYSPRCLNEWVTGACEKPKVKCGNCEYRNLEPLSDEVIRRHLTGQIVVGSYPMLEDETCTFLVVDFDKNTWKQDVSAFMKTCEKHEISAYIERSRSGNGGHVWFFFAEPIKCYVARNFALQLLNMTMSSYSELSFDLYDRLLPNQDTMPAGGFGNLIALPLQGASRKENNAVFVDKNFDAIPDQWGYLSKVQRLSLADIEPLSKLGDGLRSEGIPSHLDEEKPWDKSSEIGKITQTDFPEQVEVTLYDGVYISKTGVSNRAVDEIKKLSAFRNPDFFKAQAMHYSTFNKPRVICTAEQTAEYVKIPIGLLHELHELIESSGLEVVIDDKRISGTEIKVKFLGELRNEQYDAFTALTKYENGVLSATTAFGKTVLGAKMIAEKNVSTLILVHTSTLMNQWRESLERFLDVDEVGALGSSKNELTGEVDIAIDASVVNNLDVLENYGMVIIDECHHISSARYTSIMDSVKSKYIYGLTATPDRTDGHHPLIFQQCGPIRYEVSAKSQAERRGFKHILAPRFTNFELPIGSDEKSISAVYKAIVAHSKRNKLIVDDVVKEIKSGRTPIILTERKEHVDELGKLLADKIDENVRVFRRTGGKTPKQLREQLEELKLHISRFVIVATGKYVGEGFDEPRLDTLFLAMPVAWKGTIAQYVGRLHREYEGKHCVKVFDYIDLKVPVLERMYYKRLSGYKHLGYSLGVPDDARAEAPVQNEIYDASSYWSAFTESIKTAKKHICISSPYISKRKYNELLPVFTELLTKGVEIVILTKKSDKFKFEHPQIKHIEIAKISNKFAVIDGAVIWYGDVNPLGNVKSDGAILNFENIELAQEILTNAKTTGITAEGEYSNVIP